MQRRSEEVRHWNVAHAGIGLGWAEVVLPRRIRERTPDLHGVADVLPLEPEHFLAAQSEPEG
jgi:hypothetical protein